MESMPIFNGDGPVPMETPGESVDVSSDDSSEEEEGGEREKGPDSEATDGESRAPLPRRRSRALRLSPSDDEDDDELGNAKAEDGPSMNILINLMTIVALTFSPLFIAIQAML